MANLKEIKIRLNSVKSTRKITSAMKMVSAAKLRRAQDAIIQMRPFDSKLQEIYHTAGAYLEESGDTVYSLPNSADRVLIVPISSNRGLCGAFNSNVVKKTLSVIAEKYKRERADGKIDIIGIGKKAADILRSKRLNIVDAPHAIFDSLTMENASAIVEKMISGFLTGKYRVVEIIYNQFRNAAVQDVVVNQLLPIVFEKTAESKFQEKQNFLFEPSAELLLKTLIPTAIKIHFFKALLDSHASEHGARMTAMHKATDNATELIKEFELKYNKARQASITNELLEIVSGANALRSQS